MKSLPAERSINTWTARFCSFETGAAYLQICRQDALSLRNMHSAGPPSQPSLLVTNHKSFCDTKWNVECRTKTLLVPNALEKEAVGCFGSRQLRPAAGLRHG